MAAAKQKYCSFKVLLAGGDTVTAAVFQTPLLGRAAPCDLLGSFVFPLLWELTAPPEPSGRKL